MNMLEIPQGAGSGFLWDDKGELRLCPVGCLQGQAGGRGGGVVAGPSGLWLPVWGGCRAKQDGRGGGVAVLRQAHDKSELRLWPVGFLQGRAGCGCLCGWLQGPAGGRGGGVAVLKQARGAERRGLCALGSDVGRW